MSNHPRVVRRVLANNGLMIAVAILAPLSGTLEAVCTNDWEWFARSGSLMIGVGIALLARQYIAKLDQITVVADEQGRLNISDEYWAALGKNPPRWVLEYRLSARAIGTLGPWISIIGTIIWGYGDQLGRH